MPNPFEKQSSRDSLLSQGSASDNETYNSTAISFDTESENEARNKQSINKQMSDEGYDTGSLNTEPGDNTSSKPLIDPPGSDVDSLGIHSLGTAADNSLSVTREPISKFEQDKKTINYIRNHGYRAYFRSKIPFRKQPAIEKILLVLYKMNASDVYDPLHLKLGSEEELERIKNEADLLNFLNNAFEELSNNVSYWDQDTVNKLRKNIRQYAGEIGYTKRLHDLDKQDRRIKKLIGRIVNEIDNKKDRKEMHAIKDIDNKLKKLEIIIENSINGLDENSDVDKKRLEILKTNKKRLESLKSVQKAVNEKREEWFKRQKELYGEQQECLDRQYAYFADNESIKQLKEALTKSKRKKFFLKILKVVLMVLTFAMVTALSLGAGAVVTSFLIAHGFSVLVAALCGAGGTISNFFLFGKDCFELVNKIRKNGFSSIFKDERGNYISKGKIAAMSLLLIPCIAAALATGFITFNSTAATILSLCAVFGAACPPGAAVAIAAIVAIATTIGLGILLFMGINKFIKTEAYKKVANYFKERFYDIWIYSTDENGQSWADLTKREKAAHIGKGILRCLGNLALLTLKAVPAIIAVAATIGISHSAAITAMTSVLHFSILQAKIAAYAIIEGIAMPALSFFYSVGMIMLIKPIIAIALHPQKTFRGVKNYFSATKNNSIRKIDTLFTAIKGILTLLCIAGNSLGQGIGAKNATAIKYVGMFFQVGHKIIVGASVAISGLCSGSLNLFPSLAIIRQPEPISSPDATKDNTNKIGQDLLASFKEGSQSALHQDNEVINSNLVKVEKELPATAAKKANPSTLFSVHDSEDEGYNEQSHLLENETNTPVPVCV